MFYEVKQSKENLSLAKQDLIMSLKDFYYQQKKGEALASPSEGVCVSCGIDMDVINMEYHCPNCGCIEEQEVLEVERTDNNRVSMNSSIGRIYNPSINDDEKQRNHVKNLIEDNVRSYTGLPFDERAIINTVNIFNTMQRTPKSNYDKQGNKTKTMRSHVWRGEHKKQIIASVLYYECIRIGQDRARGDIAKFMKLDNEGFSRGENVVLNFHALGIIEPLPIDKNPTTSLAKNFLNRLGIYTDEYFEFIIQMVEHMDEMMISTSSRYSSKIAGCIWLIKQKRRLKFTSKELEIAADNVKYATYNKVYTVIKDHPQLRALIAKL